MSRTRDPYRNRQLLPRWVVRRIYRSTFQPDVEEERRVRNYLYGRRTQVDRVPR